MIYKKAIAARMEAQEVQADYYNEHHGVVSDIVTGDLVFCEVHNYNTSEMPTKLLPRCSGPWKVLRISSKGAYISHVTSGVKKPASLRHLKKVRLTSEQMQQLEDREFYHDHSCSDGCEKMQLAWTKSSCPKVLARLPSLLVPKS